MARLVTDPAGRLLAFDVLPGGDDVREPGGEDPYAVGFELAGLDPSRFRPVAPTHRPPHDVDERMAWVADDSSPPRRVEAALRDGALAAFQVTPDWPVSTAEPVSGNMGLFFVLLAILFAGILTAGIVLARRNLASGRGDRRGAFRLAAVVFGASVLFWVFVASHTLTLQELVSLVVQGLSTALFMGAAIWILYVALEPAIRSRWPQRIVGWTRAMDGRFRDPLVGRDLLLGALAAALVRIMDVLPFWIVDPGTPLVVDDLSLHALRWRGILAAVCDAVGFGLTLALGFFVLLLVAHLVLRRPWLAATAFWAVMVFGLILRDSTLIHAVSSAITMAMVVALMMRFGLLAWATLSVVMHCFVIFPHVGGPGSWHFGMGLVLVAIGLAPALWGAWVCSAQRPRRLRFDSA
jgi:serine/threonine-protein kinase